MANAPSPGRRTDLEEVCRSLEYLRRELSTVRSPEALEPVRRQVDDLLERVRTWLDASVQTSPALAFKEIRSLDEAFRAVDRAWNDFRGRMGLAEATELRDRLDSF